MSLVFRNESWVNMTGSPISLAEWLDKRVGAGLDYPDNVAIAKATGLSEKTIRRLRNGEEPGLQTLKKLSNGLNYPLTELQKMAGILADDSDVQDDLTRFLINAVKRLSPSKKREARALLKQMLEEQRNSE